MFHIEMIQHRFMLRWCDTIFFCVDMIRYGCMSTWYNISVCWHDIIWVCRHDMIWVHVDMIWYGFMLTWYHTGACWHDTIQVHVKYTYIASDIVVYLSIALFFLLFFHYTYIASNTISSCLISFFLKKII